jgi:hypothetical protein
VKNLSPRHIAEVDQVMAAIEENLSVLLPAVLARFEAVSQNDQVSRMALTDVITDVIDSFHDDAPLNKLIIMTLLSRLAQSMCVITDHRAIELEHIIAEHHEPVVGRIIDRFDAIQLREGFNCGGNTHAHGSDPV